MCPDILRSFIIIAPEGQAKKEILLENQGFLWIKICGKCG
jgi:hypothetical protein